MSDHDGSQRDTSMEDALAGMEAIAEAIRNDPMAPVHMAMLDAELAHRGMKGPWPRRWWRRAWWLLWGRKSRRRNHTLVAHP